MRRASIGWCLAFLVCACNTGKAPETVVLVPDNNTGHDETWEPNYNLDKNSWGVRGDPEQGQVYEGRIWFEAFPGESGRYRVVLGAILEEDGEGYYRLTVGDRVLKESRYPLSLDAMSCEGAQHRIAALDLGVHDIQKNERIEMWARTDVGCSPEQGPVGTYHGSHVRWYELTFTPEP